MKEESHQCVLIPVRRTYTMDRWKHMAHERAQTKHGYTDKSDSSSGFQNSYYFQYFFLRARGVCFMKAVYY